MDEETRTVVAIGLLVLGLLLIGCRHVIGRGLAGLYRRIGIDVPEATYLKQFLFVGVLLIILGFLTASGLIEFL
jgi:hypothetical protein